MEHHEPPGPDPRAPCPLIHAEDLVIDRDPLTLEEATSQDAIHVSVRLDLDVWRWLLAQGGTIRPRFIPCCERRWTPAGKRHERRTQATEARSRSRRTSERVLGYGTQSFVPRRWEPSVLRRADYEVNRRG